MSARHRWMVLAPYDVTVQDARRIATGEDLGGPGQHAADEPPAPDDPRPFLGLHNIAHDLIGVICWTCEQPYSDEIAAQACPGEPDGKLAYVDDDGHDLHPTGLIDVAGTRVGPGAQFRGVNRNDPCPCGSGRKYKRCHGASN